MAVNTGILLRVPTLCVSFGRTFPAQKARGIILDVIDVQICHTETCIMTAFNRTAMAIDDS